MRGEVTCMNHLLHLIVLLILIHCGSDSITDDFGQPSLVAIDSTNDRLFILEEEGILSILTASNRRAIGNQPFVNSSREKTIHSLLPTAPMEIEVIAIGSTSRLFISGTRTADDRRVLNQILVLDFDGTSLSQPYSPIAIQDADPTTDDTDNVLGGMEIDPARSRLYATDSSLGALYTLSINDGSAAAAAIILTGNPNELSLDGNRLYITNSTATAADQLITVVNVDDFSATTIDLDIRTDGIAAFSNSSGTVLMIKQRGVQRVHVHTVNTTTFAGSTPIPVGDSSAENGLLSSSSGLSAAVGDLLLTRNASSTLFGYLSQSDGIIKQITFAQDLSSFTVSSLETITKVAEKMAVLNDSNGDGSIVYIASAASGGILFTDVGSSSISVSF